ncbi:MAG: hypothetical protein M1838_002000 [Thelocarpon superellum]|nr:MAG: hypothetical protein M1838_002000 [Thelocarpon superellum]
MSNTSRTVPLNSNYPPHAVPAYQYPSAVTKPPARRTLSNGTTSTSTTGSGLMPVRTGSNASLTLRRSTSTRSGTSPCGYVALMRKQKATVWCDRAQHEDPRLVAQQKAAKMRAAMEIVGAAGRTSTHTTASTTSSSMMSRTKIRHHNKPAHIGYTPASLVGGVSSVPMRLSASEVGDDGHRQGESSAPRSNAAHRRSGSGLSSMGTQPSAGSLTSRSAHLHVPGGRLSQIDLLNNSSGSGSSPDGHSEGRTPSDPFPPKAAPAAIIGSGTPPEKDDRYRMGMGAVPARREPRVGEPGPKSTDELKRRGSVDDRTMTMSAGRLFVANPDLSD